MRLLLEVLRTVDFLPGDPPELAEEFLAIGRSRTLPAGHAFWHAGAAPDAIVIPVDGELAAVRSNTSGREVCYAFFGTGETAGVPCVLDGTPHPRNLRVIRGGEFFVVERAAFLRFIDAHPDVGARVVSKMGQLFRRSLDERDRIVFLSVGARLARFLLERTCVLQSDGARVLVRETQPELAIRLGSVREVIAREMANCDALGILHRTRRGVFVLDWEALVARAAYDDTETPVGLEHDSAALRTRRFFLPAIARGPEAVAVEARVCREQVPDASRCAARGCPLAGTASRGDETTRGARAKRDRNGRSPPGGFVWRSEMRNLPAAGDADPPSDTDAGTDDPGPASGEREHFAEGRARHPITQDDARDADVQREIERRVEVYRRRVAAIEAGFGSAAQVPADTSLFRELEVVSR